MVILCLQEREGERPYFLLALPTYTGEDDVGTRQELGGCIQLGHHGVWIRVVLQWESDA